MKRLPQKEETRTEPHSKGELGAVAERGVVRAVHRRLAGEPGVKLAHVLVRLLQWHKTREGRRVVVVVVVVIKTELRSYCLAVLNQLRRAKLWRCHFELKKQDGYFLILLYETV